MLQPYLTARQILKRAPTAYENLLADSFENAFRHGALTLEDLSEYLNRQGPAHPAGSAWSAAQLAAELEQLAKI